MIRLSRWRNIRANWAAVAGLIALLILGARLLSLPGSSPADSDASTRVLLGGDIGFAESYPRVPQGDRLVPAVEVYGYDYSIKPLAPLLRRADYTVLNLEGTLTDRRPSGPQTKDILHWSDPHQASERLVAYGVDAVSLANNHTMDLGAGGLVDTVQTLDKSGIRSFGAGPNATTAAEPLVREIRLPNGRSRTIAVFGMFEYKDTYANIHKFYATDTKPGVTPISVDRFRAQVKELRRTHPDAFVIAFPHWGSNYTWRSVLQIQTAHDLINSGADMVIGHHGHTLQEVEKYKGKWILYGIGNFMFNSPGRYKRNPDILPFGGGVELSFKDDTRQPVVRLYPIYSDNVASNYLPRFANPKEVELIRNALVSRRSDGRLPPIVIEKNEMGDHLRLK